MVCSIILRYVKQPSIKPGVVVSWCYFSFSCSESLVFGQMVALNKIDAWENWYLKRLRTRQKSIQQGDGIFSLRSFETQVPLIFGKSIPYNKRIQVTSTTKGRQVLSVCSIYLTWTKKPYQVCKKWRLVTSHLIPSCQDPRRTTLMFSLHCILQPLSNSMYFFF